MRKQSGPNLWVTLSASEIVEITETSTRRFRRVLDGAAGSDEWLSSFGASIAELIAQDPTRTHRVAIVAAPPLTELYVLELPSLSQSVLKNVLIRDAALYFGALESPVAVDLISVRKAHKNQPLALFSVAVMPSRILRGLADAVSAKGCTLTGVIPAGVAFAADVPSAAGPCIVAYCFDRRTDLALTVNREIFAVRRLNANAGIADIARALDDLRTAPPADGSAITLVVHGAPPTTLEDSSSDGAALLRRIFDGASEKNLVLPRINGRTPTLQLIPETTAASAAKRQWLGAARQMMLAASLLMIATSYRYYRDTRSLARTHATRAAIKPAVTVIIDKLDNINHQTADWIQLSRTVTSDRNRVGLLSLIALKLPENSRLESIRIRGDTVILAGTAETAEDVLAAYQDSGILLRVSFALPVQQVTLGDNSVVEQFVLRGYAPLRSLARTSVSGTRDVAAR